VLLSFLRSLFSGGAPRPLETHAAPAPPRLRATASSTLSPSMDALLAHAASLATDELAPTLERRVAELAARFDSVPAGGAAAILAYHADLPAGEGLAYRDLKLEPGTVDYRAILSDLIAQMRRTNAGTRLILATDESGAVAGLAAPDVCVVPLPVDAGAPMFSRALAVCAYFHSRAFASDTALLDSDAFPHAPFDGIYALGFDVALTYRDEAGVMPVNEGVMFARRERPEAVRAFFRRVLATYDRLADDPVAQQHYGDLRRWRGGQLALNAVADPLRPYSPYRRDELGGAVLRFLPCDTFNWSQDYGDGSSGHAAGRYVVHYKGLRKNARWRKAALAPEDRRYSLDSVAPQDYEPPATLDYARATLTEVADHHKTDKGTLKHRYTEVYAQYLEPLRGRAVRLLEIGVASGCSLKTWSRYLGEQASVTGVDTRAECAAMCAGYPNIRIVIADATAWDPAGEFDVIIDDGSHVSRDIVRSFERLWPRLRPGGLYAIEDLRCTHDQGYLGNFPGRAPEDFDRRHFMNWLDARLREVDMGASAIEYVHLHRQLAVLRKR
jgi:hypothetical protein